MTGQEQRMDKRISFDFETYAHHLSGLDLTENQARLLLETLFQIMVQFVDLGLGIHPIQQSLAEKPCGQVPTKDCDIAPSPPSMLLSEDMLTALEDTLTAGHEGGQYDD